MKKIQIDEKLFVQMVKYFYSDELGFDDCELNELSIRGKVPSFNVSVVDYATTEKSKVAPTACKGWGHLTFSYNDIKNGIDKKMDAISRRSYYTEYKTADTDVARERARQKYLDEVGIHEDFRW